MAAYSFEDQPSSEMVKFRHSRFRGNDDITTGVKRYIFFSAVCRSRISVISRVETFPLRVKNTSASSR